MSGALSLEKLAAVVRGPLFKPGDPRYDKVRQVWNGMIDRHPAAIVEAAGVADVMAIVEFARVSGLPLAM